MNEYSLIRQVHTALRRSAIKAKSSGSKKVKTNHKYHRILEAAVKVFAEQGFSQATISQIAKEAGVADGTIYLYFKNKDDILVHFFSFRTKQAFGRLREEVEKADNTLDKLRNLIRKHLEEFQGDMNMAVVYLTETHKSYRLVEEQIKAMSKMYLEIVSQIVEQGQAEGVFRKDLYMGLVKRFIVGSVNEVINTWIHSGGKYDLVSMSEPLVELFLKGIGTQACQYQK